MKEPGFFGRSARRRLRALIWVAALTLVGCDSDFSVSPTAPLPYGYSAVGARDLQIAGSLTVEEGSCFEATILFDGQELAGARSRCSGPGGCSKIGLAAVTPSSAGRHTISFQVLDQSTEAVEYLAVGTVLVTRNGLSLGNVTVGLGPKLAILRAGESVSFEILFSD